jgi:hypothetical protein
MKHALLVLFTMTALLSFAQQSTTSTPTPAQTSLLPTSATSASSPAQNLTRSCLAVTPIGSHAFRNIMLIGVAGALISHQQYQVVDAVNYPAKIGQKYHGNDLQTISTGGTKVAILDKHYTTDELHRACQ